MTILAFDTETWPVHPGRSAPKMVCGQFDDPPHVMAPNAALDRLGDSLAAGDRIVGQNIAFDIGVAAAARPALIEPIFRAYRNDQITDTMLRQLLIDIAGGHVGRDPLTGRGVKYSLAGLVNRHFGVDLSATKTGPDVWRTNYWKLDGVPLHAWPQEAYDYAANDSKWTRDVYNAQAAALGGRDTIPNEFGQARNAWALRLTSARGLRVNQRKLDVVETGYRDTIARIDVDLKSWGLMRENGTKDKSAIQALVVEAYGGNPPTTEKTGAPSTSKETLLGTNNPRLHALAERSKPEKYLATYVKPMRAAGDLPLNVHYWSPKETGRSSASGPPIHQFPRDGGLRECLEPRNGFVFAISDYSQIEMAALAQVQLAWFGRSSIAEALIQGLDPHLVVAAELLGCRYTDALEGKRRGDPEVKQAREDSKIANYGYAGGMGAETFVEYAAARERVITRERSYELRDVWFRAYPDMRDYFGRITQLMGGGDRCTIEQLYSGRIRGGCFFTEAANTMFQGLAADGGHDALFEVCREAYTVPSSPLYGSRPCIWMHDEIVTEVPIARAPEAAQRQADVMVSVMRRWIRDVPVEAEPVLSTVWSKKAQTLRDDNGRLLVWEG